MESKETLPSPVLLQPLWGDEYGGSQRSTCEGGDRLVPKTEQTRPKKGLDKPSATFQIDL